MVKLRKKEQNQEYHENAEYEFFPLKGKFGKKSKFLTVVYPLAVSCVLGAAIIVAAAEYTPPVGTPIISPSDSPKVTTPAPEPSAVIPPEIPETPEPTVTPNITAAPEPEITPEPIKYHKNSTIIHQSIHRNATAEYAQEQPAAPSGGGQTHDITGGDVSWGVPNRP